ncbi:MULTISPECIES: outer membrane protein assembly factor BamA [Roseobacteraceae]|uniref:outer membrane protein assembly factor BamA n=1 Tax=Mameliella sediminis TaxID=2836866 RepID=UPI001C448D77|nr:outer membrane protein assembly factor BamA [Mameliella sediminis]MBY6114507.1 outer membrane protein assembly factor BamA [Antarctobacter heliothermus]MBY6144080.1 outer membrane protein assembly factor BamA [Mameliella alba]MBY6161628.1 outer membrane protein assembly factor BamA [Mameliella alba]MBY6169906.1 outer membrane protein assembly factor BamA [Mameliella alba]
MAKVISARKALGGARVYNVANATRAVCLSFAVAMGAGVATIPEVAYAQAFVFNSVNIEGNRRVEPGTILSYAGIARGQRVSAAELNDAYQRILGSGLFETVEIIPQGSRLTIRVVEYPTINRIVFEGNRRIKDEDLARAIQSQSRRVFSPRVAEADALAISQAYEVQGRLAARVSPKVIRRSDNRVDLVFEVFEGGTAEVERIGFVGNGKYSDRRLRRVLDTKQAGLLRAVIRKDTFIEDRVEFDKQLLRDFYSARGYVDFRITGVNAELSQERDAYFVTFNVEEGQQFKFGDVSVTSDLSDVDSELFASKVRLKSGKVYSPTLVENEIARLEKLAINLGLNFVRVEPRVTRNDRDLTLDVEFQLVRGERIFIERIDIEGNTTTLDRVIRRQFEVVEGDPFNPRAIRESAERIRALGFFNKADVEAREGSSPQQVVVDVDVEEKPTGSISFGGSYSTENGLGAAFSFSERNFLGRGQSFSFKINTAADAQQYGLSFVEPGLFGRDLSLGFVLGYNETDNDNADFDTVTGVFKPFLEFPVAEQARLQLRYTLDYGDIRNADSTVGGIITSEIAEGERFDSSLGYTYIFDTQAKGLNPNTRYRFEFGQDFAGLGGDTTFVKTSAKAIAQTLVWNEEVTLRASIEGGALSYSKGDARVTDRFLIGPDIMRGFTTGGIGPREVGTGFDDSLGGNYYAVARFEAEFPLGLPEEYGITGGLFYDVGSVWGLSDSTKSKATGTLVSTGFEARHVVGFSIFWRSAIGPLRLNFTEAVKKNKWDEPQNFNLTISSQF